MNEDIVKWCSDLAFRYEQSSEPWKLRIKTAIVALRALLSEDDEHDREFIKQIDTEFEKALNGEGTKEIESWSEMRATAKRLYGAAVLQSVAQAGKVQ